MSSNGKTDEVLGAILKCLDAMDGKLSRLDPISDKVTALEAATGELGALKICWPRQSSVSIVCTPP
jgi:hypothetical protein